jgi:hypothetical protein
MSGRWEICQVEQRDAYKANHIGEVWYAARITGPNGIRTDYQSIRVPAVYYGATGPGFTAGNGSKAMAARDSVIQKLLADGWEPVEGNTKFRRAV